MVLHCIQEGLQVLVVQLDLAVLRLVDVRLEAFRPTVRVVALQDVDQVVDVRCRQSQGFDLQRQSIGFDFSKKINS